MRSAPYPWVRTHHPLECVVTLNFGRWSQFPFSPPTMLCCLCAFGVNSCVTPRRTKTFCHDPCSPQCSRTRCGLKTHACAYGHICHTKAAWLCSHICVGINVGSQTLLLLLSIHPKSVPSPTNALTQLPQAKAIVDDALTELKKKFAAIMNSPRPMLVQ